MTCAWISLDSLFIPSVTPKFVKLSSFLQTSIGYFGEKRFLVQNLTSLVANAKGGVHLGRPSNDLQIVVLDTEMSFRSTPLDVALELIRGAAFVLMEGVSPLCGTIAGNR
jgi:hypothetical protein